MTLLLIAAGGATGALARYLVDGWVSDVSGAAFPFGTLLVNISGSFLLGLLFAMAIERDLLSAEVRAPLMIGFLGAYTTFSTLMLESWRLIEDGAIMAGVGNLAASVALGLAAVVAGLTAGRALS